MKKFDTWVNNSLFQVTPGAAAPPAVATSAAAGSRKASSTPSLATTTEVPDEEGGVSGKALFMESFEQTASEDNLATGKVRVSSLKVI